MKPSERIPFRWPSVWSGAEALRFIDGTAVNCLVFSPDQPDEIRNAARARGLAVVSLGQTDPISTEAIPLLPLTRIPASGTEVAAVSGLPWPSVRTGQGGNTSAGPTGFPWVDSNAWRVLLARHQSPGTEFWTTAVPSAEAPPPRPEQYALAVADSEAFGARWLVTLHDETAKGLLQNEASSREVWATVNKTLRYFRDRRLPADARPLARLGILSDFAGPNAALAQELLNLAVRRQLPVRLLDPARLDAADLAGLKAIVSVDRKAPEAEALRGFLAGGGTLIVPPSAAHSAEGLARTRTHDTGYEIYASGNGQIAVAPKPWTDPYALATDVHRVLGRRWDVVRLWNAGSSISFPVLNRRKLETRVVNYSARPVGHPMSLWVAAKARSAKFTDPFGKSETLETAQRGEGTEVNLPPVTAYASIEFGEIA